MHTMQTVDGFNAPACMHLRDVTKAWTSPVGTVTSTVWPYRLEPNAQTCLQALTRPVT